NEYGSTPPAGRSPATRCSPQDCPASVRPPPGSPTAKPTVHSATPPVGLHCSRTSSQFWKLHDGIITQRSYSRPDASGPQITGGNVTKQHAAVLGTGQTHHRSKRTDVSMAGLVREAVDRAMADADVDWADIDAVVVGKAPDLVVGGMMPELALADAVGATGKPMLRVHTAGSVGGATALVAASHVQAGIHRRVLTLAFEKQSESNAMWALSIAPPFTMPVGAGAGGHFAPHVRSYIRRAQAPEHVGAMVAA